MMENKIITDWLDKHGNPDIYKKVEDYLEKTNMENKIPTAEEFVKQYQKGSDYFCITKGEAINKLKEFAKLHVEAALESASENVGLSYKQSILNSYPENLIK